ncbi:AMP-binding protein [Roseimaritima ulvae]|uniref:AMP-binding protein n=1 Tax=Roseimaritima ulvae TaxID=980254 RepID=UPI001390279F|nr:AMP-binding protein [Roseimaritima ulvae]
MFPSHLQPRTTLNRVLLRYAQQRTEDVACTFVNCESGAQQSIAWGPLIDRAQDIAHELFERGLQDQRVVLAHAAGLDFYASFLGCLYAGAIAIPIKPPTSRRGATHAHSVLAGSGAKTLLSDGPTAARVTAALAAEVPITILDTDQLPRSDTGQLTRNGPPLDLSHPDRPAYLQYTSGSTGTPQGVVVRHRNLIANLNVLYDAVRPTEADRAVCWLPHFHDMGLVTNLFTLAMGMPLQMFAFQDFAGRPMRWLRAISEFGATLSGGPNFAFQMCAERAVEQDLQELDLRRWRFAFCGAEPIRRSTLDRFADKFSRCGFDDNAFRPCYGLAEATLAVTLNRAADLPRYRLLSTRGLQQHHLHDPQGESDGEYVVGCGVPAPEHQVAILGTSGEILGESQIGEIVCSGPSISTGYWADTQPDGLRFQTADDGGSRLRTGDLGFLEQGQLFVVGRLKDLIILSGRNHAPHQLEATIRDSHVDIQGQLGAAFPVDREQREQLVVVHEVAQLRRKTLPSDEIFAAVQANLYAEHGVTADDIVLVRRNQIPRTSSGKIQRSLCKMKYLADEFRVAASHKFEQADAAHDLLLQLSDDVAANRQLLRHWLCDWIHARVGIRLDQTAEDHALTDVGIDSLAAMELHHELARLLGPDVHLPAIIEFATLGEFVDAIAQKSTAITNFKAQKTPTGLVDDVLSRIETLTDSEVKSNLQRWMDN